MWQCESTSTGRLAGAGDRSSPGAAWEMPPWPIPGLGWAKGWLAVAASASAMECMTGRPDHGTPSLAGVANQASAASALENGAALAAEGAETAGVAGVEGSSTVFTARLSRDF